MKRSRVAAGGVCLWDGVAGGVEELSGTFLAGDMNWERHSDAVVGCLTGLVKVEVGRGLWLGLSGKVHVSGTTMKIRSCVNGERLTMRRWLRNPRTFPMQLESPSRSS